MKKLFIKILALIVLIPALIAGWLAIGYSSFDSHPFKVPEQGLAYEIRSGATLTSISRDLEQKGVISNSRFLLWYAKFHGKANHIQAGTYHIQSQLRPGEFLDNINSGKVMQHSLTLVEGWTFKQMMERVHADENLVHTLTGKSQEQIMAAIGHAGEHPEGRFLPDTYLYPVNTTDVEFLQRSYDAMAALLEKEWQARDPDLPLKSPYEALILASIVERETAVREERFTVASVFTTRLRKGMRLQTDPTVIYGMGDRYKGNIRKKDLREKTPYNTYQINGLPPTPIAMPAASSVNAALHPDNSGYLYFVAMGDGRHFFSKTLYEHEIAVDTYQRKGRKRNGYRSTPVSQNP